MEKVKIKAQHMTIVNHFSCHRYIFQIFNIVFLTKQQEKHYLFMLFLTVIFFPKNIQRSFTLIRPLKKIENHKSCCHLYYAIQTKLYLNRREEHFVLVESRTFSLLKEYKKLIFYSFVAPCQYYALRFQCT